MLSILLAHKTRAILLNSHASLNNCSSTLQDLNNQHDKRDE
jgi:hypothetical protein